MKGGGGGAYTGMKKIIEDGRRGWKRAKEKMTGHVKNEDDGSGTVEERQVRKSNQATRERVNERRNEAASFSIQSAACRR